MDNRNRVKINVSEFNEAAKHRVSTEPGSPKRISIEPDTDRVPTEPEEERVSLEPETERVSTELGKNRVSTEPSKGRVTTDPNDTDSDAKSGKKTEPESNKSKKGKKAKKPLTKKRKISIAALVIGIIALAAGIGFFVYNLLNSHSASDAEYLVEIGAWQLENSDSVVWDFTEVGKGTLTTNDHVNNYDFTWLLDGDQLKIDTAWLSTLNDEFTYHLDQSKNQLEIEGADGTLIFIPAKDAAEQNKNSNSSNNKNQIEQEIDDVTEESVENSVEE